MPYRAAVEGVGVLQRPVDDGGVGEDDEPEAAGAAGDLVAHDGGLRDLAVGGEVLAQLVLRRFPGDAADEELALVRLHLSSSASALRLALACCCGGGERETYGERGRERNWGFPGADLGLGAVGWWFWVGYFRSGARGGDRKESRPGGGFRGAFRVGLWTGFLHDQSPNFLAIKKKSPNFLQLGHGNGTIFVRRSREIYGSLVAV